jgi:hypothetical protein
VDISGIAVFLSSVFTDKVDDDLLGLRSFGVVAVAAGVDCGAVVDATRRGSNQQCPCTCTAAHSTVSFFPLKQTVARIKSPAKWSEDDNVTSHVVVEVVVAVVILHKNILTSSVSLALNVWFFPLFK